MVASLIPLALSARDDSPSALPVLALLPVALAALFRNALAEPVVAGTDLAAPGEPCDSMLLVLSGEVEVRRLVPDADDFAPVALLGPGDWYGSHCASGVERHAFRVHARTDCIIARLSAAEVRTTTQAPGVLASLRLLSYPAVRLLLRRLLGLGVSRETLDAWLTQARSVKFGQNPAALARARLQGSLGLVVSGVLKCGERWLTAGELAGVEAGLLGLTPRFDLNGETGAVFLLLPLHGPMVADELRHALAQDLLLAAGRNPSRGWCDPTDVSFVEPEVEENDTSEPPWHGQPSALRRVPHTFQRTRSDCAVACLCVLLEAHGVAPDYEQVRARARVSRYGTSLHDLQTAAEDLGFRTAALRASFDDLRKLSLPAIVHLPQRRHYVVLWRVTKHTVVTSDPSVGKVKESRDDFCHAWDGVVLTASPTVAIREKELSRPTRLRWRWLWPLLRRHRRSFASIVLAAVAMELFGLLSPIATQTIVDFVIPAQSFSLLTTLVIALSIIQAVVCALEVSRAFIVSHVSAALEGGLLDELYRLLVRAKGGLLERYAASDLVARFADVAVLRDFISSTALTVCSDLLVLLPASLLIIRYDLRLSLLFGAVMLVTIGSTTLLASRLGQATLRQRIHYDRYRQHILDSLNGNEAIVYQGLQREFIAWARRLMNPVLSASRRLSWTSQGGAALINGVNGAGATLVFWYGVRQVLNQSLSLGEFVAFGLLSGQISSPVMRLIREWASWQRTALSFSRVSDLLQDTGRASTTRLTLQPPVVGQVEFSDVDFAYGTDPKDGSRLVLHKLSFQVPAGQVVGIVGRSGSGKSTLVKLLLGLLEPKSGAVLIDGVRTVDLDSEHLTRRIGYVSQSSHLFSGSVFFNIGCGRDVSLEEVSRAAMLCGAYDFISELPFGFGTLIGERGMQLSGGQKQRILLARALVGDPPLLILDEATAALDPLAEQAIFSRLEQFSRGRTTLIITHRIATLRHVHRVLVIENGRLCEDGAPAQLEQTGGMFQRFASATPLWGTP